MTSFACIAPAKLSRLLGLPTAPVVIDTRDEADFSADPRLIPTAQRRPIEDVEGWAAGLPDHPIVVSCQKGAKRSQGVAAWLRALGRPAESLEGGHLAWAAAGLPLVPAQAIPPRDARGRTVWVTRARPKIDRIACPWLIRRFVDPAAVFLFVSPADVAGVAEKFGATPFDVEGVSFSHRGELCSFDVMIEAFGLTSEPLTRLAAIVRGADTARPDLAPECAGLLAASLGLSRMHADDLAQLGAGMALYDAFYRWARDAVDETHNWPAAKPGVAR